MWSSTFFKKHSTFFALVGAFVVFVTFVVKDLLRDNLKDLASALAETQLGFILRQDNLMLSDKLDLLDTRVDDLQQRSTQGKLALSKKEIQTLHMIYVGQGINRMSRLELDHIQPLVQKVSNPEQLAQRIKTLNQELDALDSTASTLVRSFRESHGQQKDWQKNYDATSEWITCGQQAESKATKVVSDTLNAAEIDLGRDEHRLKRYTSFSYALYTLGWAVALLGKLYGAEGPEVE
jgi:hypothetical protein